MPSIGTRLVWAYTSSENLASSMVEEGKSRSPDGRIANGRDQVGKRAESIIPSMKNRRQSRVSCTMFKWESQVTKEPSRRF